MAPARKNAADDRVVSASRNKVAFTPGADTQLKIEDTALRHPRKIVLLHWLTVFCLCGAAGLILLRDEVSGRALRQWLLEGHRHFGLFVLMLFVIRITVRLRVGRLASTANMPAFTRAAAALTHIVMYALLLALPLLGWALSSAQGKPVHLFGATLPALVGADDDLADSLQTWHVDAAWLLLALVILHVSAALWHHFILRDDILRKMLPGRRR
ncbi:cytochrome b [Dyella caseinilytica]|uniref:Cytochrome b n=1 Tax=Dyella caseinilytica TaxID=1849581 RepID=A0ABX7GZ66_9GAMM|nr:cytochrome b [Dyella caseinilytica]